MGGKWSKYSVRISRRCSDVALLRMKLFYISLPEILVFSAAYCFFENIANMKRNKNLLIIRYLWFLDKMMPLRKIYSRTTIGLILNREQKTRNPSLLILLFLSLDSKLVGIWILVINITGGIFAIVIWTKKRRYKALWKMGKMFPNGWRMAIMSLCIIL